jgi:hypothetical protein
MRYPYLGENIMLGFLIILILGLVYFSFNQTRSTKDLLSGCEKTDMWVIGSDGFKTRVYDCVDTEGATNGQRR